MAEINILEQA